MGAALVGSIVMACATDAASAARSGNCPAPGSRVCPNDTEISQSAADDCQKSKADAKCGGKYVELLECTGTNASCDADDKLDNAKLQAACQAAIQAWTTCVQGPTPDGG